MGRLTISRSGSRAYHGTRCVEVESYRSLRRDPKSGGLIISCYHVPDFNTRAHHDYELVLHPDLLAEIRKATEPPTSPEPVEAAVGQARIQGPLTPTVPRLLRALRRYLAQARGRKVIGGLSADRAF